MTILIPIFAGSYIRNLKPIFDAGNGLSLCSFDMVKHAYFIPVEKEKRFGLFNLDDKKHFIEIDDRLEQRLIKIPEGSKPELYLKEIDKFHLDMKKFLKEYEKQKEKLEDEDTKGFINSLIVIGVILVIVVIGFIIMRFIF